MAINFPASLDSLTNPTSSDSLNSPSHSSQHADANDAIEALQAKVGVDGSAVTTSLDYKVAQAATLTGTQTLTNKTLTSPTLNTATINNSIVQGLEESWSYNNQAISGAETMDTLTSTAYYNYTTATGNFTLNVRGNSGTTLSSLLAVGDSITVAWAITNGATARYLTALSVDGVAQTVKWQGGAAPTAGNANSVDVYVFTILKTAATPTYVVLGSLTQFA
jgi:hypothetical protein